MPRGIAGGRGSTYTAGLYRSPGNPQGGLFQPSYVLQPPGSPYSQRQSASDRIYSDKQNAAAKEDLDRRLALQLPLERELYKQKINESRFDDSVALYVPLARQLYEQSITQGNFDEANMLELPLSVRQMAKTNQIRAIQDQYNNYNRNTGTPKFRPPDYNAIQRETGKMLHWQEQMGIGPGSISNVSWSTVPGKTNAFPRITFSPQGGGIVAQSFVTGSPKNVRQQPAYYNPNTIYNTVVKQGFGTDYRPGMYMSPQAFGY